MSRSDSIIHHKPFIFYWFARASTALAYQMQIVAVGWQIYSMTNSAFYLGLVGLAQFLPMFCLTLAVGYVADHYDRRRIIQICQIIEGLGIIVLAIGSYNGWLNKESILAIVFILGAARAFEGPTMQALLPGLVTAELFPRATALASTAFQVATIIGPALGGLLYSFGPAIVYSLSSALFLIACFLVFLIKMERFVRKHSAVSFRSLFAGIGYIRSKPMILGAISLDLFAVLLGGATALLPAYARDILHTGPWGLGLLRSAPSIGALLLSFYLLKRPLKKSVGKTMFIAVAIFGIATIVFAVSRSFVLSLATLIVLGAADIISVVIRSTLVQLETPDKMRGRVSAVNSMFIGTSNQLGEFESGITAAWFGIVPSVLIGGIGTLVVVAVWIFLFPTLFQADTLRR